MPIVFPIAGDPVGAGFVETLARPGGNATGFMTTEYSIGGKWLELLKIAPDLARVAVLRDSTPLALLAQCPARSRRKRLGDIAWSGLFLACGNETVGVRANGAYCLDVLSYPQDMFGRT